MARFSDVIGRTDVPFLTAAQKKALLADGTLFSIVKAQANPSGKFGAEWRLTIQIAGEDLLILSMKATPARDHEFEAMARFLDSGEETVGPVRLEMATSKAGNDFAAIVDAEGEAPIAKPVAKPAVRAAAPEPTYEDEHGPIDEDEWFSN